MGKALNSPIAVVASRFTTAGEVKLAASLDSADGK